MYAVEYESDKAARSGYLRCSFYIDKNLIQSCISPGHMLRDIFENELKHVADENGWDVTLPPSPKLSASKTLYVARTQGAAFRMRRDIYHHTPFDDNSYISRDGQTVIASPFMGLQGHRFDTIIVPDDLMQGRDWADPEPLRAWLDDLVKLKLNKNGVFLTV